MPHSVLHILGTAQREGTGVARIVASLARSLPKRFLIHAYFLGAHGPLAAELEAAGVPTRVFNFEGRRLSEALRFWRGFDNHQFSIIHQHAGGSFTRHLARWGSRAAVVLHLHGRVIESEGHKPIPIRVQGADVVIANSRAVAKHVVGRTPRVIYTGVPVPEHLARGNDAGSREIVIGTGCRLVPIKGIPYLVRAFSLLRPEFPHVRLEIAGEGPEATSIEDMVNTMGLHDSVKLLGWKSDFASALASWDIFVLPSLEEGFGIAALEAMAAGLPVVASSVGGLLEIVEDGKTGWLVPAGESVQLAERLRVLLLEPESRGRMGIQGHARARACFSEKRMVAEMTEIYDQLA